MLQRPGIALTALVLLASLAACGGGEEPTAARVSTLSAQHAEIVLAPMLSDDGSIMPSDPEAAPADYCAPTRAGHYASRPAGGAVGTRAGARRAARRRRLLRP